MTDLQTAIHDLRDPANIDRLVEQAAGADAVLIGEATHGTSEFYLWRAHLTQRLISEHGFSFVAVEGDWPNCYDVNRFVKGLEGAAPTVGEAVKSFDRWPTWMWANEETLVFIDWLAAFNKKEGRENPAGFYGLDIYSLWESLAAITNFLEKNAPETVEAARSAYRCFEPLRQNPDAYAHAPAFAPASCEDELVDLLTKLRRLPLAEAADSPEGRFNAEQNAIVALNAEQYYRTLVGAGPAETWNLRERHMVDTFRRLLDLYRDMSRPPKGIIWAHNTHVGDAVATDMPHARELSVGQLVREHLGRDNTFIVGFGTYRGTVTAADSWDGPTRVMKLPPARAKSWDEVLARFEPRDKLLLFEGAGKDAGRESKGQRAVGVIYDPLTEWANYVPTVLRDRYDALIYIDRSHAVHSLDVGEKASGLEETFPFAV